MLCLAVGFTVGSAPPPQGDELQKLIGIVPTNLNWHFASLAAATTAIIATLCRQSWLLTGARAPQALTNNKQFQFGRRLEAMCRVLLALVLLACLLEKVLVVRRFVSLPDGSARYHYGDDFTIYIWWLAIAVFLDDEVKRASPTQTRQTQKTINAMTWLAALALILYVLWDLFFVPFLVHVGTSGVDSTLAYTGNRYRILSFRDETCLASLGMAAAAATILAGYLLFTQLPRQNPGHRTYVAAMMTAISLLLLAAGYAVWFYGVAYPSLSPDLAAAGFESTWLQRLGGVTLGALVIGYASYRVTRSACASAIPKSITLESSAIGDSLTTILLIIASSIILLIQFIGRDIRQSADLGELLEELAYLLAYPDAYFMVAIFVRGIQLAWLRWRGVAPAPIHIASLKSGRFLTAAALLTALAAIAIPTFSICSFSFWLGPWYRW
jgi:hypothetical protein